MFLPMGCVKPIRLPPLTEPRRRTGGFICRALLVVGFVYAAHQLNWIWLRFFTSQAILHLSSLLGMTTRRISFDTIRVQGAPFQFVVACTFVDVFAGSIPLLWDLGKSVPRNIFWLLAAAAILFCFNVLRLELAQILYVHGVSWTLADGVVGGFAYFSVALAILRFRNRQTVSVNSQSD
jgi:exosortase/archaeosortase